ncbi:MAG: aminotransferase class I/II-fold pyridoxal phosphate-dependent enzyme [Candidatus Omnitrophica bacterium]|nr:aminotransferase class I/II-fold pyridoxal phosphate-dependent enzyme [Candidatus Omnitrophota bacterium]
MGKQVAKHIEKLPPSGIRVFFDLVLGMPDVISLGVGEPDFITPWKIREKAITALEEGYTSYTSNQGLMVLRQSISTHLRKRYGLKYKAEDEILITVGVSEGLDLALRSLCSPQDKVIVVSPHYVAYPAIPEIIGAKTLYLVTKESQGFKINPKELSNLLRQKPKAMILNYPCNPSGVTYTEKELKDIWKEISKTDTVVISDETYDELTYDQDHLSFASLGKQAKNQTILLNGFSKSYAMTGFRTAYACANKEIIAAMTKIHSFSMLCGPIISQIAAVEALHSQKEVDRMRKEYKRRRDFIVKELNRIGLPTIMPQGAFYCLSSIKQYKMDSMKFATKLLNCEKVAVVPGKGFGQDFDSYVRISYASTFDDLKEAIVRIERFLNKL